MTCLATTSLSTFTIQYGSLVPVLKMTHKKQQQRETDNRNIYHRSFLHANAFKCAVNWVTNVTKVNFFLT